jgi:hypothetical protein
MPFFLLKGLSFLPFGGILKNPKILIAIIIIAGLVFGYFKWKSAIKEAIFNEIYAEQVEEHLENQRQEFERIMKLTESGNIAVKKATQQREVLIKEVEQARQATRNVTPERNGPVAPVLSEALDFIRSRQTAPAPIEETLGSKVTDAIEESLNALRGTEEVSEPTGNSAIDEWKRKQEEAE